MNYVTAEELAQSVAGKDKLSGIYYYNNLVVFRFETDSGKRFLQAHKNGNGYSLGAPKGTFSLFMADKLEQASDVLVVEGEKTAIKAAEMGLVVTTSAGGARAAAKTDWSPLAGKTVTIWPDHDEPGNDYARDVVEALRKLNPVPTIKLVDPFALKLMPGDDLYNYWEEESISGHTDEQIAAGIRELINTSGAANERVEGHFKFKDDIIVPKGLNISTILAYDTENDQNSLLGNRWLCRGGGVLWAGATGIGKSSGVVQAVVSFGLGEPFFGIKPVRPLRVLVLQAENDIGDLSECLRGVLGGLKMDHRGRELDERIVFYHECARTGEDFAKYARALILLHKPDLVVLDPLLAYLGGDVNDQKVCSHFLRNLLNPIAQETGIAWIIIHHTPKPSRNPQNKLAYMGGDFAYLGAGSAELANWPRAVLVLREVSEGIFELRGAKRGKRAGLLKENGTPADGNVVHIKHSESCICWVYSESPTAEEDTIQQEIAKSVLKQIPITGTTYTDLIKVVEKEKNCKRTAATLFFGKHLRSQLRCFNGIYLNKHTEVIVK